MNRMNTNKISRLATQNESNNLQICAETCSQAAANISLEPTQTKSTDNMLVQIMGMLKDPRPATKKNSKQH